MPDFGRWTSNGGDPSLNEINRSEKFIEALSLERQVYATDREEAELAVLLAGWRDDARQTPMTGIATPREAVKALDKATGQGRVRIPMALVGSMAAAVLCLGGFGAAVYGSGPGDALYGVRGLVFGSAPVTRDVGVELASSELKQVQQMIRRSCRPSRPRSPPSATSSASRNSSTSGSSCRSRWRTGTRTRPCRPMRRRWCCPR